LKAELLVFTLIKRGKNCNIICALLSNINPVCGGYLISSLVKCYFKERMGIVFS